MSPASSFLVSLGPSRRMWSSGGVCGSLLLSVLAAPAAHVSEPLTPSQHPSKAVLNLLSAPPGPPFQVSKLQCVRTHSQQGSCRGLAPSCAGQTTPCPAPPRPVLPSGQAVPPSPARPVPARWGYTWLQSRWGRVGGRCCFICRNGRGPSSLAGVGPPAGSGVRGIRLTCPLASSQAPPTSEAHFFCQSLSWMQETSWLSPALLSSAA